MFVVDSFLGFVTLFIILPICSCALIFRTSVYLHKARFVKRTKDLKVEALELVSIDGHPVQQEKPYDPLAPVRFVRGYKRVDIGSNFYNKMYKSACYKATIDGHMAVLAVFGSLVYEDGWTYTCKGFWATSPYKLDKIPEKLTKDIYVKFIRKFDADVRDCMFRNHVKYNHCIKQSEE